MTRWIGLLDCNNFFVSCERLFRPDLLHTPVAVLSSNDGCIVARSQEVKDIDIPMGVPYFQVKDILRTNNVQLFSGNHRLYRAISKRVFNVMKSVHSDIEQYSIDEAFFYFIGSEAEVRKLMSEIKLAVETQVGVPVSVGVSTSKTLAKVANDIAKKTSGEKLLDLPEWREKQKEFPLSSVWGVGRRLSASLRDRGLVTVFDYVKADSERIKQTYGVVGARLLQELQGTPASKQKDERVKQSIMSSRSFAKETTKLSILEEAVLFHIEQVSLELRHMQHGCKVLGVSIAPSRHGDFALQNKASEQHFTSPVSSTRDLAAAAVSLLKQMYTADVPYKKVGVRVSHLQPKEVAQLDLFAAESNTSDVEGLQQALDDIQKRFTTGRVHLGFLEGVRAYSAKSDLRSPAYMSDWKDLPTVKA